MSNKPEALRLTDALEFGVLLGDDRDAAGRRLRRQHAEIESLKAECDALRDDIAMLRECVSAVSADRERLQAECDALRAALSRVADIAHNGGLVEPDLLALFVAIRRLTLLNLDLSGTTDQIKARVQAAIDAAREGK